METLCQEDIPDMKGYMIKTTKKRNDQWGGIMFAVKEEFANQVQIKNENTDNGEIMFVQMTCGRSIITIGLVYAPQENQTTVEEMDKMYKYIENQIIEAKMQNQIIIIGGDFNCKVGDIIEGNKKEITKGGM